MGLKNIGKSFFSWLLVRLVLSLKYKQERPPRPCIVGVWHEDMLVTCKFFSNYHSVTLASPSDDSQRFSIPVMEACNNTALRYTSSKSDSAMKGLYELMKYKEHCIVIPMDASRGPRRKAKGGVFALAKRNGLPLYACRFDYGGVRIKSTWDKMKIPYPFAKIRANISKPIFICRDKKLRQYISEFERIMQDLGTD